MSYNYPSYNGVIPCKRCRVPLAANERLCENCGFYNAPPSENTTPQHNQQPNQPLRYAPPLKQSQQRQDGGLLKRYPTPTNQNNTYSQPSSFQATPPRPFPAQMAHFNSMPNQAEQQPAVPSPYSTGPTTPSTSFNASFNQLHPPTFNQMPRVSYEAPSKRQQTHIGKIIGALVLLLIIVGGSFLAYTMLFAHQTTQQATNTTTSSTTAPNSAPQGTPLFQDTFTDNTHGWSIQSYPGEFSVALGNGALKLENDNNKLLWELIPGNKNYADFRLSVDATLTRGSQDNGYGIYFRSSFSQNMSITTFYRFELYGDGSFAVFKGATDANGTTTTPRLVDYTNDSSIQKQGSLNHITINTKGSRLQFIINGQTISTITDPTYTNGSIALFVSNLQKSPPGAEVTFSHLAIYPAQQ